MRLVTFFTKSVFVTFVVAADKRKNVAWAFSPHNFRDQTLANRVGTTHSPLSTKKLERPGRESSTSLFDTKRGSGKSFFEGVPSTPGFKPGQIDKLTSWAVSTTSNRPIVAEYEPDAVWLWTQWEGTIREMTYKDVIFSLCWAFAVNLFAYYHYATFVETSSISNDFDLGGIANSISSSHDMNPLQVGSKFLENMSSWMDSQIRHSDDPFMEFLQSINTFWEYNLQLSIFTLSFFVNQAYNNWRMVYFATRSIQGRINDICLLLTLSAARSNEYGEVDGITGYQTQIEGRVDDDGDERDAKKLVQDVTRLLRISHTFFWAVKPICSDGLSDVLFKDEIDDNPTDSDGSRFGPLLLSPQGLEMLVKYGQLTRREVNALKKTNLAPSQYPYVLMEWAGLRIMSGLRKGELVGGPGLEENFLRQITQLRAEFFNIGDYESGRMSKAYIIAVEMVVDALVFLAPLALYPKMGTSSIIASGLITLSFKGLLELSKAFLDTFGKEGYRSHNIRVDVLMSELNFGAARRWVDAGDSFPSEKLDNTKSASRYVDLDEVEKSIENAINIIQAESEKMESQNATALVGWREGESEVIKKQIVGVVQNFTQKLFINEGLDYDESSDESYVFQRKLLEARLLNDKSAYRRKTSLGYSSVSTSLSADAGVVSRKTLHEQFRKIYPKM
mmetsp:Transcript_22113/g.46041  ORF Transcript_22113/g.46041 Transcript_22113/m.46041 type:complete len:674 (+) Transcript_22113:258-2279(+)